MQYSFIGACYDLNDGMGGFDVNMAVGLCYFGGLDISICRGFASV